MQHFWLHGYGDSAIADLVAATGSTRQALYNEHGGKHGLFLSALLAYPKLVVDPAFAPVEAPGASTADIRNYFLIQIDLAAEMGLPGPGCLMANSMTDVAPHDPEVRQHVESHNKRLARGFANALRKSVADERRRSELGEWLAISAQGLWSHSRLVDQPEPLYQYVNTLMSFIPTEDMK